MTTHYYSKKYQIVIPNQIPETEIPIIRKMTGFDSDVAKIYGVRREDIIPIKNGIINLQNEHKSLGIG